MAKFPYTQNSADLKKFLDGISSLGVPSKVDRTYLLSIGARKGSADRLRGVLKSLGLIDSSGGPTDRWKVLRDANRGPTELGVAIREPYSELFRTFPDAQRRSREELTNFFKSNTELGDTTVKYAVRTFRTLCELADFGPPPWAAPPEPVGPTGTTEKPTEASVQVVPKLQLNIQIHIAADTSEDKIETIFRNMRKYLLPNVPND